MIALVSDSASIDTDHDMAALVGALNNLDLETVIAYWDDPTVDWEIFDLVLLCSPWSYVKQREAFTKWVTQMPNQAGLHNPAAPALWSLDKRYLLELHQLGFNIVPTTLLPKPASAHSLHQWIRRNCGTRDVVIKPTIGANSANVRRFRASDTSGIHDHLDHLGPLDGDILAQSYMETIDTEGEVNLVYFDGEFSHAILKAPLLHADGTVDEPTQDKRSAVEPRAAEIEMGSAVLRALQRRFQLDAPLLYGRIDLVRTADSDEPRILEVEICEPSLSLDRTETGAKAFANSIAKRLGVVVPS